MTKTKIIFDTDPGIDDAMALLFAHYSPDIDIVGITTVLGNASLDTVTRNALHICERFDISAPVHKGAAAPLLIATDEPPAFVHGDDGLGNINPETPNHRHESASAAQFIVDQVLQHPHEITLVAVGRLTNLALALRLNPEIASLVKEVVIMGGALGTNEHTGNVTPVAEANIYGDPHAADIVLTADWPLTLVGLDVTMTCVMQQAQMRHLRDRAGQAGQFIWDISRHYEDYYHRTRGVKGFPVHDSCAIAYVLAPDLFKVSSGAIRVVTEGISIGQTIMVPGGRLFPPGDWHNVPESRGCVGVDAKALLELYDSVLLNQ
jgi:inosine-uridine nucleoside N-ribohydrolase